MNWTGGRLQRHSKASRNEVMQRQKQHFAKIRQQAQNDTTPSMGSFTPAWQLRHNPNLHEVIQPIARSSYRQLGRGKKQQKTLEDYALTAPLARRLASLSKKPLDRASGDKFGGELLHRRCDVVQPMGRISEVSIHHSSADKNPHIPTSSRSSSPRIRERPYTPPVTVKDELEQSKIRLLKQPDWVGLGPSRPLQMNFVSPKGKHRIGKRRKMTGSRTKSSLCNGLAARLHRSPLFERAVDASAYTRGAPRSLHDNISVRIGENVPPSQTMATVSKDLVHDTDIHGHRHSSETMLFEERSFRSQCKEALTQLEGIIMINDSDQDVPDNDGNRLNRADEEMSDDLQSILSPMLHPRNENVANALDEEALELVMPCGDIYKLQDNLSSSTPSQKCEARLAQKPTQMDHVNVLYNNLPNLSAKRSRPSFLLTTPPRGSPSESCRQVLSKPAGSHPFARNYGEVEPGGYYDLLLDNSDIEEQPRKKQDLAKCDNVEGPKVSLSTVIDNESKREADRAIDLPRVIIPVAQENEMRFNRPTSGEALSFIQRGHHLMPTGISSVLRTEVLHDQAIDSSHTKSDPNTLWKRFVFDDDSSSHISTQERNGLVKSTKASHQLASSLLVCGKSSASEGPQSDASPVALSHFIAQTSCVNPGAVSDATRGFRGAPEPSDWESPRAHSNHKAAAVSSAAAASITNNISFSISNTPTASLHPTEWLGPAEDTRFAGKSTNVKPWSKSKDARSSTAQRDENPPAVNFLRPLWFGGIDDGAFRTTKKISRTHAQTATGRHGPARIGAAGGTGKGKAPLQVSKSKGSSLDSGSSIFDFPDSDEHESALDD